MLGRAIVRRVIRLSFYHDARALKLRTNFDFPTDWLGEGTSENQQTFIQHVSQNDLECLGFLYLFCDHDTQGNAQDAYVSSAVIMPPPYASHYVHSKAIYKQRILGDSNDPNSGIEIKVEGSFFAQQQGVISSCGHAAVMVALRNMFQALELPCPLALTNYEDINRTLGIDHETRLARKGIEPAEIKALFERAQLNTTILSADATPDDLSAEDIIAAAYYAVETGLPAIICFGEGDAYHAMTVVGHTFDPCKWAAKADEVYFSKQFRRYKPSLRWVSELIVQDDNFGPYCTLALTDIISKNPIIVTPQYYWSRKKSPMSVEILAAWELMGQTWDNQTRSLLQSLIADGKPRDRQRNFWFNKLVEHAAKLDVILRTTPSSKAEYSAWLLPKIEGSMAESDVNDLLAAMGTLDSEPFWLVEISIPELYQHNNRRLGEIVLREIVGEDGKEFLWPCVIRLPGTLTVNFDFDYYEHHDIPVKYHYEIVKRGSSTLAGQGLLSRATIEQIRANGF